LVTVVGVWIVRVDCGVVVGVVAGVVVGSGVCPRTNAAVDRQKIAAARIVNPCLLISVPSLIIAIISYGGMTFG
jgi:hypothetical protein